MVQLKGQIEMMGMVIIVVLLIVIGVLFISLNINNGAESSKFLTLKANNLMNAIDKVTLNEGSGGDLIASCCEGGFEAAECSELREYFEDLTRNRAKSGLDAKESASLVVEERKVAGICNSGVSSQTLSYPQAESCSVRVVICEI